MNEFSTKLVLSICVGFLPILFINNFTNVGNFNFDLTFGIILAIMFFGLFYIALSTNNEGFLSFLVGSLISLILVSSFQIISSLFFHFFQYRELTIGFKLGVLILSIVVVFIISIITVWVSLGSFEYYDNKFKCCNEKPETKNTNTSNNGDIESIITESKKFFK